MHDEFVGHGAISRVSYFFLHETQAYPFIVHAHANAINKNT